jgi:hypothetical protein
VKDKQVLQLIGRILKAKVVLPDGTCVNTEEGTPQGGPLSGVIYCQCKFAAMPKTRELIELFRAIGSQDLAQAATLSRNLAAQSGGRGHIALNAISWERWISLCCRTKKWSVRW